MFFNYSALITTKSINAGSLLLQHPIREADLYSVDQVSHFGDKVFKTTCCDSRLADIDAMSGEDHCALYFQRRPLSSCDGYTPPALGTFKYLNELDTYRISCNLEIID